jgi:hypothetical protein
MRTRPTSNPFIVVLVVAFAITGLTGCQVPSWMPETMKGKPSANPTGQQTTDPQVVDSADIELDPADSKLVLGWVEWIEVEPEGIRMKAKLDSGADTSSINAMNLRRFRRDGQRWARFEIFNPATGERVRMERPLSRTVRIVKHGEDRDRRPVVELEVRLGALHHKTEFTLIDRSSFSYQVLIGRSYLRGYALIDPDRTFLCKHFSVDGESVNEPIDDTSSDEDALDDGK